METRIFLKCYGKQHVLKYTFFSKYLGVCNILKNNLVVAKVQIIIIFLSSSYAYITLDTVKLT